MTKGFIKLPNEYIGRLLDKGRSSMHALHLLAVKIAHGESWVLNENHVSKKFGIGRRRFRSGLHALQEAGLLLRQQTCGNGYASDTLQPAATPAFTILQREHLTEPSDVVAFIVVANLAPTWRRPAHVAKRFGITGKQAIARITERAVTLDAVAFEIGPKGAHWVARRGLQTSPRSVTEPSGFMPAEFVPAGYVPAGYVPAGYVPAGFVPAHIDASEIQKESTALKTPAGLHVASATLPPIEVCGHLVGSVPSSLVQWKRATYFHSDDGRYIIEDMSTAPSCVTDIAFADYEVAIDLLGPVPAHIRTRNAYEQVCQIADTAAGFCSITTGMRTVDMIDGVFAVVARIARAHKQRKVIRSLGFIAEGILRPIYTGDDVDGWAYRWPCRLSDDEIESLTQVANRAIHVAHVAGFETHNDALLGRRSLLELDQILKKFDEAQLLLLIANATSPKVPRVRSFLKFLNDCALSASAKV